MKEITLQVNASTHELLEDMCINGEANDIADAVGRLMSVGAQAREQFHKGFTEVVFQNPIKRSAYGIDLLRNLRK